MRRSITVALLVIACDHPSVPSSSSASVSPTTSASAPSASTVVFQRAPTPDAADPTMAARVVLKKWNDAHNAHDSKALATLYAEDVRFYGEFLPAADCARRKAAAFAKSSDYAQSIGATSFTSQDGGYLVRFTKTSTSNGKSEESDKVTDEAVRRARMTTSRWCVEADGMPNDAVKPPFTVSAIRAMEQVLKSKHVAELRKKTPMLGNDTNLGCPTPCTAGDPTTCGLSFRLFDMSQVGIATSTTLEFVQVDAVNDVMWWEDYGGASITWKSESLKATP